MSIRTLTNQFSKFAVVGFSSTAINYAVFFVMFKFFGLHYAWSHVVGYLAGVIFGYFLNRSWTFTSIIPKKRYEFSLYISIYVFSLIISVAALQILVERTGLNPLFANIFAIGVSMIINFAGLKWVVFDQNRIEQLKALSRYFTAGFWVILASKIAASFLFGSHFLTKGFVPFADFFSRTLTNPYEHFYTLGQWVFPYPGGMLALVSWPLIIFSRVLPESLAGSLHLQMFLLRLPVLILDVLLYVALCRLLPTKEKKVLLLYFASPVLFYINYYHGQLDVIPTALLFLSILMVYKQKHASAFALLGLSMAAKTHILAALPFYLIYYLKNRFSLKKIGLFLLYTASVFLAFNLPLISKEFFYLVFKNPEQNRLFGLAATFGFENLKLFVAPSAIVLIFYRFATYKKINFDSLLLGLGLVYIVLIALVPPMQGWFYWSLPFLVFFFLKFKDNRGLTLWAMNGAFLLYFALAQDSDIFESLGPIFPTAAVLTTPFDWLTANSHDAFRVQNFSFTLLESLVIVSAVWAYQTGTSALQRFQKKKERWVFGIAGDSGVGKSTLAGIFLKALGKANTSLLNGDDVHRWERNDPRWQSLTHLHPKGNKIHTDLEHLLSLLKGENIQRLSYDHATGKFIGPLEIKSNKFLLLQGLMPFLLEKTRELHDLKIFVEAEHELRLHWKSQRDEKERSRSPEEIEIQIQNRKPDAEKFIYPQKNFADWVIRYEFKGNNLRAVNIFKNSVDLESLYEELSQILTLEIEYSFPDINFQSLSLKGSITSEAVKEIAYRLFPNLYDLLEHEPEFEEGLNGLHQLLLINYLNHLARLHD